MSNSVTSYVELRLTIGGEVDYFLPSFLSNECLRRNEMYNLVQGYHYGVAPEVEFGVVIHHLDVTGVGPVVIRLRIRPDCI